MYLSPIGEQACVRFGKGWNDPIKRHRSQQCDQSVFMTIAIISFIDESTARAKDPQVRRTRMGLKLQPQHKKTSLDKQIRLR